MNTKSISIYIAQMGPIGTMKAPGTMATLFTLPLVFLVSKTVPNWYIHGLMLCILMLIARYIIIRACTHLNDHQDPSSIVLDELIGCLIVFWAIPCTFYTLIGGFILFRFFDISKIGGIKYLEQYGNGWGILLDDVAAALASNALLHLLF